MAADDTPLITIYEVEYLLLCTAKFRIYFGYRGRVVSEEFVSHSPSSLVAPVHHEQ